MLQEVVEIHLPLDSGNKVDGASDVLHEGGPCYPYVKGKVCKRCFQNRQESYEVSGWFRV